jgi:hypothetical protein
MASSPLPRWVTLLSLVALLLGTTVKAAPLFRPNDVVALVGGEDMVAASEFGELELLITAAYPDHRLRFRSLAWEGDTVYEQRRDLNYPKLEEQLEKIGATVVICQFGSMECFDGEEKVVQFVAAYRVLLHRLTAAGKRRAIILTPCDFEQSSPLASPLRPWAPTLIPKERKELLEQYQRAVLRLPAEVGKELEIEAVDVTNLGLDDADLQRDGIHLTSAGHAALAQAFALKKKIPVEQRARQNGSALARLHQLINEKNRLWFHYYRPQNWAFLAGDRTSQPSSRDHKDPNKRWFPEELEQFLPLIAAKETAIAEVAGQLSGKESR